MLSDVLLVVTQPSYGRLACMPAGCDTTDRVFLPIPTTGVAAPVAFPSTPNRTIRSKRARRIA